MNAKRRRSPEPKRNRDLLPIFESVLVACVIAVLGYFLTVPGIEEGLFLLIMVLQILVSSYAGYKIFPRLFKNRELESYQETVVSAVIPILKAETRDTLHFAFSEAISKVIGGIDRRTIRRFLNSQNENIREFIKNYQSKGSLNTQVLEDKVATLLRDGPTPIEEKSTD